ncbi:fructose-1,6-bisphosphatase [Companilactobacillus allii]|uniref:Fructose-1,6-bisphosphatase class 3 n=1 Tax=Companilactobacillus allii TaxID=1847728 RepID=A0A1P8Q0Q5_9LACO|nr:fructose-1,6-bisphosphatase [Companilactobacillus allii]APX71379.1 fructose-1,6-bisphosphatase [Companilactobacillus allii]USQ68459.1 fructose-1,6-bisphosphatase [Companilactobacillus allii]
MKNTFTSDNEIKSEIINLSAILNLPKGTEAFVSDIHGEYDEFAHIVRNGSGNTKQKISELFTGRLTDDSQKKLAFLIYYPSEILRQTKTKFKSNDELNQWYITTFNNLIEMLQYTANKYTRSKVRKAMDSDFVYITEELLYADLSDGTKHLYYSEIMDSIIRLNMADAFIISTCHTIQKLVVDHLHIIGDVYDRGPHPDLIIEHLMKNCSSIDFQWGNHDILWIGSVSGSKLCMANLVRISARYDNLDILSESYGIDFSKLEKFALKNYQPKQSFDPKSDTGTKITPEAEQRNNCVQQAIAIIQFKLEGQAIKRNPSFKMSNRLMLGKLSDDREYITISDKNYSVMNGCFQLVDKTSPYELTADEASVVDDLITQFVNSKKLHKHMNYMVKNGSMYLRYNGNLLLHGCVPVDDAGEMLSLKLGDKKYSGKELFDLFDKTLREAFDHPQVNDCYNSDILWYLWTGSLSPLFGKATMTTFERYFVDDKVLQHEKKNPYYSLRKEEWFDDKLLNEFSLDAKVGHIINGHTPVKSGHSPIMANGKIFVIDGGMSKPYHKTTGIGGYTLLYNSYGLQLVTHEPFTTRQKAIADMTDVVSTKRVIEQSAKRKTVGDTDIGKKLKKQIAGLSAEL